MSVREVFGMLSKLSPQDVAEKGILFDFTKGVLESELSEYGISVEMTDGGIELKCEFEPKMFSNLGASWADDIGPVMIHGCRMNYKQSDCTEAERLCDFLSCCDAMVMRLDFLDWLDKHHKILFGLGLVLDTTDFNYVITGETEDHKFLAKFTDMRAPTQDGIEIRDDNQDEFFALVKERDNAQIIAMRRRVWREGGIDVQFTDVKDGKYAVSANIHDENGSVDSREWPTSKEARAEITKIYMEKYPDSIHAVFNTDTMAAGLGGIAEVLNALHNMPVGGGDMT